MSELSGYEVVDGIGKFNRSVVIIAQRAHDQMEEREKRQSVPDALITWLNLSEGLNL